MNSLSIHLAKSLVYFIHERYCKHINWLLEYMFSDEKCTLIIFVPLVSLINYKIFLFNCDITLLCFFHVSSPIRELVKLLGSVSLLFSSYLENLPIIFSNICLSSSHLLHGNFLIYMLRVLDDKTQMFMCNTKIFAFLIHSFFFIFHFGYLGQICL